MSDVTSSLKENQVVLHLVPKMKYNQTVGICFKTMSDMFPSICYVSFNKPASSVMMQVKKSGADESKFHYIDVLTGTVSEPSAHKQITYVRSASALTDLGLAVTQCSKEAGVLVFDSIATLLVYNDPKDVENFLHHVITKTRVSNKKMLIISLKDDAQSELIKDLYVFVDDVAEIEE